MKNKITFKAYRFDGDRKPSSYDILIDGQVRDQIWYCEYSYRKWSWAGASFKYLSDAKNFVREQYAKGVAS